MILIGYTDSDFQWDKNDRKSISGLVSTLDGSAIVWRSVRQDCMTNQSRKAEYVTACKAAKQGIWFHSFLPQRPRSCSESRETRNHVLW